MAAEVQNARVLVVDDEPLLLETLAVILAGKHFAVKTSVTVEAALDCIAEEHFDLLLCDLNMPGDGANVILRMRAAQPRAGVIVITGYVGSGDVPAPVRTAADAVLVKPVDVPELLRTMQALATR